MILNNFAHVQLLSPITNRVILVLSAVNTTRESAKTGFGLINPQPDVWELWNYALSHSVGNFQTISPTDRFIWNLFGKAYIIHYSTWLRNLKIAKVLNCYHHGRRSFPKSSKFHKSIRNSCQIKSNYVFSFYKPAIRIRAWGGNVLVHIRAESLHQLALISVRVQVPLLQLLLQSWHLTNWWRLEC